MKAREIDYTRDAQGWGHAIHNCRVGTARRWSWLPPFLPSYSTLECMGHGEVRKGDTILLSMTSGKVARYLAMEIRRHSDPPDLWSGKFACLGYK